MSNFDGRITALRREVEALKNTRVRSSALMATLSKNAAIAPQINGDRLYYPDQSYENITRPTKYGVIKVQLEDDGLCAVYLTSDRDSRVITASYSGENPKEWIFKLLVVSGNSSDNSYCNGDPNIRMDILFNIQVVATTNFSYSVYQENYS